MMMMMMMSISCLVGRRHTHSSTYKTTYTDVCKTYYTIPVNTTVFLKMDPWIWNM
jgi:hypothetical protein